MSVDMNVIYAIIISLTSVGIIVGIAYLRRKGLVTKEDLQFASTLLGLGLEVFDQLDVSKEKEIKKIAGIIMKSINYAISVYDKSSDIESSAYSYALDLCGEMNVELNDERKSVLKQLITLTLKNIYGIL